MREQDYMKIMSNLREDYISEAVSWDGTPQKNRRSIRRMSYGIGAIAASLAVVIGGIGYGAYRDRLAGNNDSQNPDITEEYLKNNDSQNPNIAEEHLNILGGYGEIHGYLSSENRSFFRDDKYIYVSDIKWAIDGSTGMQRNDRTTLLTDGKQLYTQYDGNVYITDSYGKETFAFALDTLTEANCIRQLPNGDYAVVGTAFVDAADIPAGSIPMPHTDGGFAAVRMVVYHTDSGKNDVVMSAAGVGDSVVSYEAFQTSNRYWIDMEANGCYFYNPELQTVSFSPFSADTDQQELDFRNIYETENYKITDFAVVGDMLYYERVLTDKTEDGKLLTMAEFNEAMRGHEDEYGIGYRGDYETVPTVESTYPCYTYFGEEHAYGVMQKQTDAGFMLRVMRSSISLESDTNSVFDIPLAELYGNDIPDRMERPDADFLDTGDYLIFSLPEIGVNGEEAVQVNLKTGTWFYLGENYTVTQTPEQSSEPDSTQSENTNFLGGSGTVHVFHAEDNTSLMHWAEDDLYFYDLESGKRARKSEDGEMYLEMLPEELQTQWYPQYSCILETDGENFYAQRDFTLNRVAEDGTETPFLTLHEDWDGTELKSVFYQKLHLMQADKLFVLASGIPNGSEASREIPLIMDVRTGEYEYLINQEEPNSWGYGKCTDDCIYLISDIGSQLREYRISEEGCTQTTIMLSQDSDFSINLSYVSGSRDRWLIGEDGKLWFVYQNAWCCAELDETKDNFLKKQVISETIPYSDTNTIIKSTGKMLTYVSKDNSNMGGLYKGLQISNYDGSDAQILVPDDRSCILLGSYCDNGVYHIALTEIAGTMGNPQTVFLTKDGISISSVGVKDAE